MRRISSSQTRAERSPKCDQIEIAYTRSKCASGKASGGSLADGANVAPGTCSAAQATASRVRVDAVPLDVGVGDDQRAQDAPRRAAEVEPAADGADVGAGPQQRLGHEVGGVVVAARGERTAAHRMHLGRRGVGRQAGALEDARHPEVDAVGEREVGAVGGRRLRPQPGRLRVERGLDGLDVLGAQPVEQPFGHGLRDALLGRNVSRRPVLRGRFGGRRSRGGRQGAQALLQAGHR